VKNCQKTTLIQVFGDFFLFFFGLLKQVTKLGRWFASVHQKCCPKQEGHTKEFSWNLTKVML
jgi:hypothetical protein